MTDKVVDASALAAIIFLEPGAPAAERAFLGATLHAPGLLWFELGNICVKKIRAHPEKHDQLFQAYIKSDLFDIQDQHIDYAETIALSAQHKLSFYDASYLWLAQSMGVELVTLDDKLAKAAARG